MKKGQTKRRSTAVVVDDSAAAVVRKIDEILRDGFTRNDTPDGEDTNEYDPSASGEGYYVYTTGPDSTTVYVGYRASEYHSNRWYDITEDNQLEQIREILADAGYVSSRPDEIYIQCSQP